MSRRAAKRNRWMGKKCVLCGGRKDAEGLEHAPPKVMFREKDRPKGLEAPACDRCNNGSGEADQMAAFLAFSLAPEAVLENSGLTSYAKKLVEGTANNTPRIFETAKLVHVANRNGDAINPAREVSLTPEAASKIALWAAKQALVIWYTQTEETVSHKATINVEVLTNLTNIDAGLEKLIRGLGVSYSLKKSKASQMDYERQFSYKARIDPQRKVGAIFTQYHGGLAFLAIINDRPSAKLSNNRLKYRFSTNSFRGIHRV